MATTSVNQEAANNLLSDSTLKILDLLCEGPISGFARKNPDLPMDPLMSIYFDDVPIRNVDGSYNYNVSGAGFAYDYMLGSGQQSGIPGFQKVEVAVPLQSNTLISNPAQGQGPYKTVVTTINTDTYPDADSIRVTVRVPALYSQDTNGNTNGYELSFATDISLNNGSYVAQSPAGVGFDEAGASTSFNGKCTTAYLRTITYTLPKTTPPSSRYSWRVRVRRTSQDIQSIRTQNAIFVDSISVISTNGYAYPNTAMSAISIASNQFSSIPTRSYDLLGALVSVPNGYTPTSYNYGYETFALTGNLIINEKNSLTVPYNSPIPAGIEEGMRVTGVGIPDNTVINFLKREATPEIYFHTSNAPTVTSASVPLTVFATDMTPIITPASYPTIWTGDFRAGVWTDNPAWVFYDMITDPVHGLGDYIPASSVDKWSLYQIAQYCDEMVDDGAGGLEPRFTCNVAIQQPDQAYSVLLNLASTFRSMMYYANGTIQLSQTTDDKVPVYEFTNANVVNGAFSYADTAKDTRSTVAMVKWRDPNNGFREAVQYIEDVEGIQRYGYVQKDVSAFACTSPGQAYRLGTWMLQTERLLTETVTFQTSLEGLYLRPGDNFAVYDNFRNNRSQGGRIVGFNTGRSFVDLDRPVTLSPGITYTLTAITPKAVFDPVTITGSDQIDLIRQSQIETYRVIDTPGVYSRLGMAGQFDSGLYVGSPWVLSASGYSGYFDSASFYTCLATSEIEPGKIEVLGLQSNTGIQFLVSTGYTIVDDPPNAGDSNPIDPPTSLTFSYRTGALSDATFYQNLLVSWTDSPDLGGILAQYTISGRASTAAAPVESITTNNSFFWDVSPGNYEFNIAAVSIGGETSSYLNGSYTVPNTNPFGRSPPLSGVFITEDFDDYLFAANGAYTGFVGTTPTLGWNFQLNANGDELPAYDLITGYSLRASGFDGTTNYLTSPIIIEGRDNSTYTFPENFLYNNMGGYARRGFQLFVDTMDEYGGIATGGMIKMNNPAPKAPQASGFVGFNGGFQYTVTPQLSDADTSGLYLWWDNSPSYTPTLANVDRVTTNFSDVILNDIYQSANYYAWFLMSDTFGPTGCPIYGPIAINPNGTFTGAYFSLDQRITNLAVSTSGLSGYLQAEINEVYTVLTSTGIAMAQYTNDLLVNTTGANASVQILARAMITGATNGTGGFPVATWGVKLNANGSAASLVANITGQAEYGTLTLSGLSIQSAGFTAGSAGWRITPSGDAEFNNVIARGSFTGGAGSSVVSINSDKFLIGNPSNDRIESVVASAGRGFQFYNPAGNNVVQLGSVNFAGNYPGYFYLATNAGSQTIVMNGQNGNVNCDILDVDTTSNFDGDAVFNSRIGATSYIAKNTSDGYTPALNDGSLASPGNNIAWQWDGTYLLSKIDSTVLGPKISTSSLAGVGGTLSTVSSRFDLAADGSNSLALTTNGSQRWLIGGSDGHIKALSTYDIRKVSSDGWTVPLNDGTYTIEFQSDGTFIYGRINGGAAITLG